MSLKTRVFLGLRMTFLPSKEKLWGQGLICDLKVFICL
ncbi:hypothetical protein D1AOALGA4SA_2745 [Olavius algarvensis Delta 1 endosymbiont]|nr:hypothetical protein D1AOALGA4SA_2745 [Olavius algarvensis Delta 1 endosymbiont]